MKLLFKEKGSTLLLAIVIVSTVLATGVAIGLVLSKQTRDMAIMRDKAVAHYVADSAIEEVAMGGPVDSWEDFVHEEMEREVKYKAESAGGNNYRIFVRIGREYYSFVRELPEILEAGDTFTIYYKAPSGWGDNEDVEILYNIYDDYEASGSTLIGGFDSKTMDFTSFGRWRKVEIDNPDGAKSIYAGFPEAGWDDQYIYDLDEHTFCTGRGNDPIENCTEATTFLMLEDNE